MPTAINIGSSTNGLGIGGLFSGTRTPAWARWTISASTPRAERLGDIHTRDGRAAQHSHSVGTNGTLAHHAGHPGHRHLAGHRRRQQPPHLPRSWPTASKGTAVVTNASTGAYTYTPNAGATGADQAHLQGQRRHGRLQYRDGERHDRSDALDLHRGLEGRRGLRHDPAQDSSGKATTRRSRGTRLRSRAGSGRMPSGSTAQATTPRSRRSLGLDMTSAITMATHIRPEKVSYSVSPQTRLPRHSRRLRAVALGREQGLRPFNPSDERRSVPRQLDDELPHEQCDLDVRRSDLRRGEACASTSTE